MNIWIINHYVTLPDTPGGTRHFEFALELEKQGHSVTVFSASFSHETRREEKLNKNQSWIKETIDGVDFIWIKSFPYYGGNDWRRAVNMLSFSLRILPVALKHGNKPDVILASSPQPFAVLSGYILAKIKRARFYFEVRDLWPQTLVDIGSFSRKSPVVFFLRILEKFLYKKARAIIVLHPYASTYITELGIPSEKVFWIPNGVSPSIFSNLNVELPEELAATISEAKEQGKLIAGYTGAHGVANALDTIIESARILQDRNIDNVQFIMVGDGPEKQRLVKQVKEWGLTNIRFFGAVPKSTIPALLHECDIGVLSWNKSTLYTKYGMSTNKLWDYMMCARPVVWAIDSLNNPVAEADCGITVPPGDANEMANAINKMTQLNEDSRKQMGIRGYEHVMKYYSTPLLVGKLLKVMEGK